MENLIMLNKVPKEWTDLLHDEALSFIESKIVPEKQYEVTKILVNFQELTHKKIDVNLISKVIEGF